MLKPVKKSDGGKAENRHFVIIASRYNSQYVDSMLQAAQSVFEEASVGKVSVVRVPGAFEIPVVAAKLAADNAGRLSGVVCLGVILRGETTHAQHIGESVSAALAQLQIEHHLPIIHEVLLLENEEQAKARCLDSKHNRGAEAAHTALEMARVMDQVSALTAA
jgi:6,7-dimethyl-8-ribityllumazine synthase